MGKHFDTSRQVIQGRVKPRSEWGNSASKSNSTFPTKRSMPIKRKATVWSKLASFFNEPRYQIQGQSGHMFLLDTHTGECWSCVCPKPDSLFNFQPMRWVKVKNEKSYLPYAVLYFFALSSVGFNEIDRNPYSKRQL